MEPKSRTSPYTTSRQGVGPTALMGHFLASGAAAARRPCPACGSERGTLVTGQQDAADQLDRDPALAHELVVERLKLELPALRLAVVLAQLVDLQLTQGVVEVSRVVGAAAGLLVGPGR